MKLLLDENLPKRLKTDFAEHETRLSEKIRQHLENTNIKNAGPIIIKEDA